MSEAYCACKCDEATHKGGKCLHKCIPYQERASSCDCGRYTNKSGWHSPACLEATAMTTCTRRNRQRPTMPIYRLGGHTWAPLPEFPPEPVHTCGNCITDDEIVRELGPLMEFVLDVLRQGNHRADLVLAFETTWVFFMGTSYRPNDNNRGRRAAVRALGLGGE